jgi:hypothetical protein
MDRHRSGLLAGSAVIVSCHRQPGTGLGKGGGWQRVGWPAWC